MRQALVPALAGLAALLGVVVPPGAVRADEVTISQNALRTGWDASEPALTPSAVGGGGFGQLFSTAVNGQVYAQPLVVGSTLIVATETDWVYGLNSTTGAVNWSVSLGTPWNTSSLCSDLSPSVGVTSTPVYDPATGAVYLIAATVVNSAVQYQLFGINPGTGAITETVAIGGSPSNDSSITFNAAQQWQRPGLLMMNGWVYAGFASHCDGRPYDGFIAGVNVSSKATTLWSDEADVTDDEAGIWQGGGGLMSDGSGRVFFVSGNGVSPAAGPGTSPPGQLAESVVRLAVQSDGSLAAKDFFSPKNAATLDSQDLDFGSGGPVALPLGTGTYPHLMVAIGKYGRFYLLNRDNLGGMQQGASGSDASLRIICCFAGEWGHPAAFADTSTLSSTNSAAANDFLYFTGNTDYLRVMKWAYATGGIPVLHTVATSSFKFGYTSGSPVVTSNGTSASSAIVWAVGVTNSTGADGTLYAFSAAPPSTCTSGSPCALSPLWSAPIGTASKFTTPATDGGHIYVGTRDGHVLGFGLTSGAAAASAPGGLQGTQATFGPVSVGASSTREVTATASGNVTVTGVSVGSSADADPFGSGPVTKTPAGSSSAVPVTFPVSLSAGDALHVPVSFTPSAPGGVSGAVSFAVRSARLPSVTVPLYGDGTQPGLYPSAGSLSLALVKGGTVSDVPVGITAQGTVQITNGGTSPETVTSVTPPTAPFGAVGLPVPGTVLQPGQSVTVQVTFASARAGAANGSFTVNGDQGTAATVDLAGTGEPAVSRLAASAASVDFGPVPAGTTAAAVVHIANAGNQPVTVMGAGPLPRPFAARYPVARGLVLNAGDDLAITITFRPPGRGQFTGAYRLAWTDRFGRHTVVVPLKGAGA